MLAAAVEELSDPRRPTVLVVEDVHWADEATLDVLRYVGRRIADLPAVLLLTYRDDEIGRDHPLRRVLGGFSGERGASSPRWRRCRASAVASLGGRDRRGRPTALYRLTGGNPFFVSEVLASPPGRGAHDRRRRRAGAGPPAGRGDAAGAGAAGRRAVTGRALAGSRPAGRADRAGRGRAPRHRAGAAPAR